MTPEERESIIQESVERALLVLPDAWSNLITEHKATTDINSKFYLDHPEFENHKDSVTSVVSKIDGDNPHMSYKEKLEKAIPGIKDRIKITGSLDMENINSNPDRSFMDIRPPKLDNGEI